jgi:hypothetical protein
MQKSPAITDGAFLKSSIRAAAMDCQLDSRIFLKSTWAAFRKSQLITAHAISQFCYAATILTNLRFLGPLTSKVTLPSIVAKRV